jgi:hypothetical protein
VATSVPIPELPGQGLNLRLSLTDDLSREWYYFGYEKYEVPVRRVLVALVHSLAPGKSWCLLDVGANMGYFSLFLAAQLIGLALVYQNIASIEIVDGKPVVQHDTTDDDHKKRVDMIMLS